MAASERLAGRAREWESLRLGLAASLDCLERDQFLILKTRGPAGYYVQVAHGGSEGVRAEAVSNRFLTGWERLDATAEARLHRLGWQPPVEVGDGPVNWWRCFDNPLPVQEIAELAVNTLVKGFDIPRVDCLVYKAFSSSGADIILPTLGVERDSDSSEVLTLEAQVDAALRRLLEVDEVSYDDDGDVPIRSGESMLYVRTVDDSGLVAVFCEMLRGVTKSLSLLDAVNEMNTGLPFARAMVVDIGVMIAAEVEPGPELERSLARAIDTVALAADEWGPKLQERFGGSTHSTEAPVRAAAAGSGPYL